MPAASAASAPALTPAPAPPAPAQRLLAWHERLRELPAAELAREIAQREPPSDAATALELATALVQQRSAGIAQGAAPNGELAKALALVEPLLRPNAPMEWKPAARWLHTRLVEQRKLEEQITSLQQQLQAQARRNEQLAAQLEALRAIERSLSNNRPAPSPPAPAPAPAPPR